LGLLLHWPSPSFSQSPSSDGNSAATLHFLKETVIELGGGSLWSVDVPSAKRVAAAYVAPMPHRRMESDSQWHAVPIGEKHRASLWSADVPIGGNRTAIS
jgi:hypothetical protein